MSDALGYVHSKGFLHLDFKPANIFVSSSGVFKLGDFGCCRAAFDPTAKVRESILVGTPGYQAPEYLKNHLPTVKCDTYAFGITAWQLVVRETPFHLLHPHVIIYQVRSLAH
jgi:serine/threonine protein kinase